MCESHCSTKYRSRSLGQGISRVSTSRRSTMQGLVVVGLIVDIECWHKMCQSHWIYRSKSPDQGTCKVCTLRRSTMQGLVVVGLRVEEILNINVKWVKVNATWYTGQGHQVKEPAESVHWEKAIHKQWFIYNFIPKRPRTRLSYIKWILLENHCVHYRIFHYNFLSPGTHWDLKCESQSKNVSTGLGMRR